MFLQSLQHLHCIFVDFRLLYHRLLLQFTALYIKASGYPKRLLEHSVYYSSQEMI